MEWDKEKGRKKEKTKIKNARYERNRRKDEKKQKEWDGRGGCSSGGGRFDGVHEVSEQAHGVDE